MNLEQEVADRARWLDGVKPGWERLVPLKSGAVHMLKDCAPCLLDFVFDAEARNNPVSRYSLTGYEGYGWALWHHEAEVRGHGRAFADNNAMPYWREEISARLARWTPSDEARTAPRFIVVSANGETHVHS